MMPDIVVAALTGPVILDTKWKRLDVAKGDALGIAQADLYQLAAYGHAYAREGVASLALVYPHIEPLGSEGLQRAWRVEGADLPLMIWTIDITKHRTGGAWRDLARWMVGDTEAPVIQVGRPAQLKAARRGRD
jgi:5-methylcytosine-specific restriction enzyme subunit McrC